MRSRALPALFALAMLIIGLSGTSLAASAPGKASTADHSKFEELAGPFDSGEAVTRACLKCHTEASHQIMQTRHWTWDYANPDTGQRLGKKTMVNAFCIGDQSNEPFCQSCHIGYGWKDKHFDFTDANKVDCLACHNTGGYTKPFGFAGNPVTVRSEYPPGSGKFIEPIDLAKIAQAVGRTRRDTCGACHYNGGGGDGVKHGDLDSSLNTATHALDVHMDKDGLNFSCSDCHVSDQHAVAGSRISVTAADPHPALLRGEKSARNPATCQACHGDKPHKENLLAAERLNAHTDTLACQTCHIPAFARGGVPTKMAWDWSQAGQLTAEGKPFQKKDEHGHVIYDSKKGAFVLGKDVTPAYLWFNGKVTYTLQDDKIDPSTRVPINVFHGEPGAADARIWPVKVFHGRQPYDTERNTLLVPSVGVPNDSAFWYNFDWPKALAAGAEATGAPFSGKYDFVDTRMLWPITHMVAPKDKAVGCHECHTNGGRLAGIDGVYIPGRDHNPWLDRLGWLAALAALLGVTLHAIARVITHLRKED